MKTVFFPIMTAVIRPLGEILTHMPIQHDAAVATAGPSFEFYRDFPLPPFKTSAWTLLHERLQALAKSCALLCLHVGRSHGPWAEIISPRLAFLQENLDHIASNFERSMNLKQAYTEHLLRRLL